MNAKKIATITISLLTAAGIVFGLTGAVSRKDTGTAVRAVTLEKGTLTQSVSATGMIYSSSSTEVYSNLNYPVATVHVSVGDRVNEGDALAELDVSALKLDIAQKRASVGAQQSASAQSVAIAQQDLDTYKYNRENNYETNLLNAEASVRTAELDLEAASADLLNARYDLRKIKDDGYDNYDTEAAYDDALHTKRELVASREITYEKAKSSLEKAQTSLEAAKVGSENDVTSYENKLKTAQINNNYSDQYIAIQKLEDDLAKATVTAPIAGTVTAVLATEGASGSGLMFVLQDADDLKIISNIKEYDIGSVQIGDKVVIKADATGDQEFQGKISKIAPTSTLTTSGSTQSSTDAEYETEIAVSSNSKGLRVGMNTRLGIITQEKGNVYVVPYEAVGQNEAGESYILIAAEQEDGSFIAEALTVTIGMETDLRVEISAESLNHGMLAIKNIEGITPGTVIAVEA